MIDRFGAARSRRGHALPVLVAVALVVLLAAVGLVVGLRDGGGHTTSPPIVDHQQASPREAAAPPGTPASLPSSGWKPVAPTTTIPTDSPVQQQYDQGFERGFASPGNERRLSEVEALTLPHPAVRDGWPPLAPANTPEGWTTNFVQGLLDVDFDRQTRSGLGAWLVAQEAPDLLPGIPAAARLDTLNATVLDPALTGLTSPIPSAREWQAYASAGIRWSVKDLHVQLDPEWQSMIAAGWQPVDLYAAVEDVSGVLTIADGASSTTRVFSLGVQLGSAHWHHGYGTVLVSGWKVK